MDLARIENETFVRRVEFHERIGSTNDRALQLAADPAAPTPLLVLAAEQTAGRGRGVNRWWSGTGALTFSLLLDWDPARSPLGTPGGLGSWPQISLAAALAVCGVVKQLVPDTTCGIRWPNDVHVNGKKICGVLPELPSRAAGTDQPAISRLVLGLGLNVNNRLSDAPAEIQAIGTSLCEVVGAPLDATGVLIDVLKGIEHHIAALERADPWLADEWRQRCLLTGHTVELAIGPRRVRGTCKGIAADGALELNVNGQVDRFHGGVVAGVW